MSWKMLLHGGLCGMVHHIPDKFLQKVSILCLICSQAFVQRRITQPLRQLGHFLWWSCVSFSVWHNSCWHHHHHLLLLLLLLCYYLGVNVLVSVVFHPRDRLVCQARSCGLYRGRSDNGTCFSPSSVVYLVSIISPMLHIQISFIYH